MNRRIETYIILGFYFAMGLVFGYLIGKDTATKQIETQKDYIQNQNRN